jgi:hypothetical protein
MHDLHYVITRSNRSCILLAETNCGAACRPHTGCLIVISHDARAGLLVSQVVLASSSDPSNQVARSFALSLS